ncbi:zinc ribbon domain protein [bacterium BMS3Bbin07]|nr:zinc ribbon domain protein [bacterium BMS3Bbin07]HDH02151.1 zinc ribbon domain-containing protein [Nitrospirota bacterium]
MPVYEYTCIKCKETFTLLQRIGTTEKDTICPHCGSSEIKKLITSFSCSVSGDGLTGLTSGFTGGT